MARAGDDNERTVERRARQEKEELVKLRRRADDLVRKAYFRYAGALTLVSVRVTYNVIARIYKRTVNSNQ